MTGWNEEIASTSLASRAGAWDVEAMTAQKGRPADCRPSFYSFIMLNL
jgi:hypothetical protein